MPPDFSRLYQELGLQPDCSVEAFRQAYRRLVSAQHPDRPKARMQEHGALPLPELIVLQEQAMQFYRRHGRLPGALMPTRPQFDGNPGLRRTRPVVPPSARATPTTGQQATSARPSLWLALAVAALIATIFWQAPAPSTETQAAPVRGAISPLAVIDEPPPQLALGMDAATVRSIQGDPMQIREDDSVRENSWDYGPSWLKFRRGRLVDWYSSPLHQLRTPTRTPASENTLRPTEQRD